MGMMERRMKDTEEETRKKGAKKKKAEGNEGHKGGWNLRE